MDLPEEYWHPRLLMEIARGVGNPIRIDPATLEYKYGFYARVMVEIDFSYDLPTKIAIEREGYCFSISVAVEHPLHSVIFVAVLVIPSQFVRG